MLPADVTPTCTTRDNSIVLKPSLSTRSAYSPGTNDPEVYVPAEVVVAWITWPLSLLVTVIFAPLTIAPVGSVTVPWILPVELVVCATRAIGAGSRTPIKKKKVTRRHKNDMKRRETIGAPCWINIG